MNSEYPLSLKVAVASLRNRLAEDMKVLYVRDVSTVTDYFVIATGTSSPHLHALSEDIDISRKEARIKMTKKGGQCPKRLDGAGFRGSDCPRDESRTP